MIVKYRNKYQVRSGDAKKLLGTHDTYEAAKKQLAAIEISKKRRKEKKS